MVGGGQKAFKSSALVQTLDLGLEAWTKRNNLLFLRIELNTCHVMWLGKDFDKKKYQWVAVNHLVDGILQRLLLIISKKET